MSTTTQDALVAATRLAEELKMSPLARDEAWVGQVQADYQLVHSELTRLRTALEELDAMQPDDFKTGQSHLTPAFREVNFRAAFEHVIGVVNKVLHNTDAYGHPLPEEKTDV